MVARPGRPDARGPAGRAPRRPHLLAEARPRRLTARRPVGENPARRRSARRAELVSARARGRALDVVAARGRARDPHLRRRGRTRGQAAARLPRRAAGRSRRARARRGHGGAEGDRRGGGAGARAPPPLVAGQGRPRGDVVARGLARAARRIRARTVSSTGLSQTSSSTDRARRWGILPAYHGWQGDVVPARPEVEAAILDAMGAGSDRPPRLRRPRLADEPGWPAPERTDRKS